VYEKPRELSQYQPFATIADEIRIGSSYCFFFMYNILFRLIKIICFFIYNILFPIDKNHLFFKEFFNANINKTAKIRKKRKKKGRRRG